MKACRPPKESTTAAHVRWAATGQLPGQLPDPPGLRRCWLMRLAVCCCPNCGHYLRHATSSWKSLACCPCPLSLLAGPLNQVKDAVTAATGGQSYCDTYHTFRMDWKLNTITSECEQTAGAGASMPPQPPLLTTSMACTLPLLRRAC